MNDISLLLTFARGLLHGSVTRIHTCKFYDLVSGASGALSFFSSLFPSLPSPSYLWSPSIKLYMYISPTSFTSGFLRYSIPRRRKGMWDATDGTQTLIEDS